MKKKPDAPVTQPALYILMRNDMDSLGNGKSTAQGVHAGNLFDFHMRSKTYPDRIHLMYDEWIESGGGFGVTLTLGVNADQLHRVIRFMENTQYPSGIVLDKTYPLQDGATLHLLPVYTCGYVFGDKDELAAILRQFDLYPA